MLPTDFQLAQRKVDTMAASEILAILQDNDTALRIEWEIIEPMGIGGSITTDRGLVMADRIERYMLEELKRRKAQLMRP